MELYFLSKNKYSKEFIFIYLCSVVQSFCFFHLYTRFDSTIYFEILFISFLNWPSVFEIFSLLISGFGSSLTLSES